MADRQKLGPNSRKLTSDLRVENKEQRISDEIVLKAFLKKESNAEWYARAELRISCNVN